LGAFNRYVSVPLLEENAGFPSKKSIFVGRIATIFFSPFKRNLRNREIISVFKHRVAVEALFIVGVLLCATLLRHQIPARHMAHMGHVIEGGTFHKMDANHTSHDPSSHGQSVERQ
ncbi:MAG TPA: hypothetical protein VEF33_03360, partial [Syntrophales bacterium]|nr:hypothetical protein [Syntrophales bacterium]